MMITGVLNTYQLLKIGHRKLLKFPSRYPAVRFPNPLAPGSGSLSRIKILILKTSRYILVGEPEYYPAVYDLNFLNRIEEPFNEIRHTKHS